MPIPRPDQVKMPKQCPSCGSADISSHSLSVWCNHCGWGTNWEDYDPEKEEKQYVVFESQKLNEWGEQFREIIAKILFGLATEEEINAVPALMEIAFEKTNEPLLGLATTEHLLEELAVRMEVTQNSTGGRNLAIQCRAAIENLDRGVLNYRTVSNG